MAPLSPPSRFPLRRCSSRALTRAALASATLLLLAGASLLSVLSPPGAAYATVTPDQGFRATVLGWSSWYGSYRMGSLGEAWCIDHGLHAPDPAFAYVPTSAADIGADTAAAISWVVAAHSGAGHVDAAAVMLAVHDLRRASYPFGVLDVDRLAPTDLAGFGGHEAELIARARSMKAEALAHRSLRGPLRVTLALTPSGDAGTGPSGPSGPSRPAALDVDGRATVTVTDANGRPVVGAGVVLAAVGATIDGQPSGPTTADGTFTRGYRLVPGPTGATATITTDVLVPSPVPATYASSTRRAQRVVRASWLGLSARATTAPPTTTTSTSTTSTTSTTTTTTTSTPTTSVPVRPTIPPATTSTTARLHRSTTTTATAPDTTDTTVASPPARSTGSLPRTGARTAGWALVGAGLVLLGTTMVAISRGWVP